MAKTDLIKSLGMLDVFCISSGAMISSGIFILPGLAFAQIGPAVFLAYLLAGICALIGTLATIELATAMPLAGGVYFYTGRSMGPLAGTISGLLNWCAIAAKSAFAIFGMSEVLYVFFNFEPISSGIILTLLFLAVNIIGTREAAIAQVVMVALLFLVMGAYIVLGLPELRLSRFAPFFAPGTGYGHLFAEAAFVFVSFGGLLDVASISEEVKNPQRNLPWGMISAIITVSIIYVASLVVTVGCMEPDKLSGAMTPLADAATMYYGRAGMLVITFGALMAFVTTANAGVMAAARFPFAMGRDKLIPHFFQSHLRQAQTAAAGAADNWNGNGLCAADAAVQAGFGGFDGHHALFYSDQHLGDNFAGKRYTQLPSEFPDTVLSLDADNQYRAVRHTDSGAGRSSCTNCVGHHHCRAGAVLRLRAPGSSGIRAEKYSPPPLL